MSTPHTLKLGLLLTFAYNLSNEAAVSAFSRGVGLPARHVNGVSSKNDEFCYPVYKLDGSLQDPCHYFRNNASTRLSSLFDQDSSVDLFDDDDEYIAELDLTHMGDDTSKTDNLSRSRSESRVMKQSLVHINSQIDSLVSISIYYI